MIFKNSKNYLLDLNKCFKFFYCEHFSKKYIFKLMIFNLSKKMYFKQIAQWSLNLKYSKPSVNGQFVWSHQV